MLMKPGDWAWAALAAGIIGYEIGAPRGQLLSERVDAYRDSHPIITFAIICYIPLHLARVWPQSIDPLTQLAIRLGR